MFLKSLKKDRVFIFLVILGGLLYVLIYIFDVNIDFCNILIDRLVFVIVIIFVIFVKSWNCYDWYNLGIWYYVMV